MTVNTVSVIGLGKLGQPIALTYAHRGFHVIGVDIDPMKVTALEQRRFSIIDNLSSAIIEDIPKRTSFEFTGDISYAVQNSDMTIIMVNTPKTIHDPLSLEYVLPACESIGEALRDKGNYHTVVLSSTVMPGTTEGVVLETLERASGKECGKDFGLCYVPEFLALGSAISNLLRPDFLLIGEWDDRSGNVVLEALLHLCQNNPPVVRTSLVNAELTKLAHNCFLITKVCFANHWAQICEAFPGADIDAVTSVLGLSNKIAPAYLKGSIGGVEGPCFGRDVKAWIRLTKQANVSPGLPNNMDEATYHGAQRLIHIIQTHVPARSTIGILGLAYKPGVGLILNSLGAHLAALLSTYPFKVIAYDPMARPADQEQTWAIPFTDDLEDCVKRADCLVITTAWDEFRQLESMKHLLQDKLIIDCWRMLDFTDNYIAIGRGR